MLAPAPEIADAIIARLNELCANEAAQSDIGRLVMDKRAACSEETQAFAPLPHDENGGLGFLHLLNGALGLDENGHGLVAVVLSDAGYFHSFTRYVAPTPALAVPPAAEPAQPKQPAESAETAEPAPKSKKSK